jgi:hypothetical protein
VPVDDASASGADASSDANANSGRRAVFALLRVTNPTLGSLRLRFAPSPYKGELDWDSALVDPIVRDHDDPDESTDPNRFTDVLPGLLLDTFTQTIRDVEYDSGVLSGLAASETVELHSAEDSIIEMGGHRAHEIPDDVVSWRPGPVPPPPLSGPSIRLVAQRASSAWFELVFVEPERFLDSSSPTTPSRSGNNAYAVSLRLEVEVGPGTWETSLIPPREPQGSGADEGFVDRVPFDLLLAYE